MRMTRYFHYLSKAKVDMLYSQLDMSPSARSTRIGFDLKVLSAGHEVQRDSTQPSLYEKLRAVEEAIERSEQPGSLQDPQPYIRDRADLWSIVIPSRFAGSESRGDTVLFCGESRDGRPFVLGGSAAHMQPSGPAVSQGLNSNFYYLQREILAFMGGLDSDHENTAASHAKGDEAGEYLDSSGYAAVQGSERLDVEPFMYDSIKAIAELHRSRNHELTYVGFSEFLARTVRVVHPIDDVWSPHGVLATPLYVCQIETSGQLQW